MRKDWVDLREIETLTKGQALELLPYMATLRNKFPDSSTELLELDKTLSDIIETLNNLETQTIEPEAESANPKMCYCLIARMNVYLQDVKVRCEHWEGTLKLHREETADLMLVTAKLQRMKKWLPYAIAVPLDDLFSIPPDDPRWVRLNSLVDIISPENLAELEDGIRTMEESVLFGNAVIHKGFEYKHPTTKEVMVGACVFLFHMSPRLVRAQALLNYAKPSIDATIALWNVADSVLMAPILERGQIKIPVSTMIYIPRVADPVCQYSQQGSSEPTLNRSKTAE